MITLFAVVPEVVSDKAPPLERFERFDDRSLNSAVATCSFGIFVDEDPGGWSAEDWIGSFLLLFRCCGDEGVGGSSGEGSVIAEGIFVG